MIKTITYVLSIVSVLLGALLAYTNLAYFPMVRGVALEEKLDHQQTVLVQKLDIIHDEVKKLNGGTH